MILASMALGFALLVDDEHKTSNPVAHEEKAATAPIAQKVDFPASSKPIINNNLENHPKIDSQMSQKILQTNMAQLNELLSGDFSNFSQTFFAPEIGIKEEVPKIFLSIKKLANSDASKPNINIEYHFDDENGRILRQRIWRLSVDTNEFAIRAKQFELNPLDKNDVKYIDKCDILFSKRGSGFSGRLQNDCKHPIGDGKFAKLFERYEIDNKTFEVTDLAIDENSKKVFGNIDNFPSIYKKSHSYSCWASFGSKVANDIKLADQGGEAKIDLAGKKFRIRLSEIEWPYGENRPSLTLYLFTNNDNYAQFYTWTEIDAPRIALAYNEYQASCTRQ